jgi:hypothetical protein
MAAVIAASLMVLVAATRPAEAAFPGNNGAKIAHTSKGVQPSNLEGDNEIYTMSVNGSNQRPLTRTGSTAADIDPAWPRKR